MSHPKIYFLLGSDGRISTRKMEQKWEEEESDTDCSQEDLLSQDFEIERSFRGKTAR